MKALLDNPQVREARDWFDGLQPRERLYLLGGAAALVILFVYFALWAPLHNSVSRLNATVTQQQQDLAWMQAAAPKLKQLQQNNPGQRRANRSMLSAVDQAINTAGLKGGLQRMEPEGRNSVKLWLSTSPFDEIIDMLGQLEQSQGITVQMLSITTLPDPGLVDARIALARGS